MYWEVRESLHPTRGENFPDLKERRVGRMEIQVKSFPDRGSRYPELVTEVQEDASMAVPDSSYHRGFPFYR